MLCESSGSSAVRCAARRGRGGARAGPVSGLGAPRLLRHQGAWTGPRGDRAGGPDRARSRDRVPRSRTTVRVGASMGVWSLTSLTGNFGATPPTPSGLLGDRFDHEPAAMFIRINIPAPPGDSL